MKLNKILFLLIILVSFHSSFSQTKDYSGYYFFPVRPGEKNLLSGTMGELRSTHFHGGIDIKTSGITGLPIYAAADGYISRIKITTGGYGNALYVMHTNGTTTVYGHLEKFKENLQKYTIKRQYENKSFSVDLFPGKTDFPVKKGDIIAYSGNSGSSSGPHLHFEIRDKNQNVMDPLRMGFKELKDNLAPVIVNVAFICKSRDARINGQFGRFEFKAIAKPSGKFGLENTPELEGLIGIEIYAYDVSNGTNNKYGIPDLVASANQEVFFSQNIRNISYGKMRNILVHTNYQNSARGGRRFNKLYKDDGNGLDFYKNLKDNGLVNFKDGVEKEIALTMKDPYGNTSSFEIIVNQENAKSVSKNSSNIRSFDIIDNTLKVFVQDMGNSHLLEVFANNHSYQIPPDYTNGKGSVYLWDLCFGLPDSVDLCTEVKALSYLQSFFPGHQASFYNTTADIDFYKKSLFDTLHLRYDYKYDSVNKRELFSFRNHEDPLKSNVKILLKPTKTYDKSYASIYSVRGKNSTSYIGGKWKGDQIEFRTRNLEEYTIDYDSVAPIAKVISLKSNKISFTIDDEKSGIKSFKGQLNGKWLLLKYDYKRKKLETDPLDPNIPFAGELLLEVTDNTGNKSNLKTKVN